MKLIIRIDEAGLAEIVGQHLAGKHGAAVDYSVDSGEVRFRMTNPHPSSNLAPSVEAVFEREVP